MHQRRTRRLFLPSYELVVGCNWPLGGGGSCVVISRGERSVGVGIRIVAHGNQDIRAQDVANLLARQW